MTEKENSGVSTHTTNKTNVVGAAEGAQPELRVGEPSDPIFTFRRDGEIEIHPAYDVTDAAKAFWQAVRSFRPAVPADIDAVVRQMREESDLAEDQMSVSAPVWSHETLRKAADLLTSVAAERDALRKVGAVVAARINAGRSHPEKPDDHVWVRCPNGHGDVTHRHFDVHTVCPECSAGMVCCAAPLEEENAMLRARVAEMDEALEPFADGVTSTWVDDDGWTEIAPKNDRICDWFGPSDFRAARRARQQEGASE